MIIAVNTKALPGRPNEGYRYFIEEVFSRLVKKYPEHQFYFLLDIPFSGELTSLSNAQSLVLKYGSEKHFLKKIWYNRRLSSVLKKIKVDVFISDEICSIQTKIPQCIIIQDLAFLHHPENFSSSSLRYYKKKVPGILKEAKVIATVSEFSKQDICRQYGMPLQKVHVLYKGVHEVFQPVEFEQKENIKQQYTNGCEYFIYSGPVSPRKNIINLLKAFSAFKKRQKSNMNLVICGKIDWPGNEFQKLLNTFKFREDVILKNEISRAELAQLTAAAYALVYPSYFEGFGTPPLEALQCSVPAIVSRTGALPEIGTDAYLYCDPENFEDIAAKMMLLYKDETLRNKLIEKGRERVRLFSWDETSQKMWECIEMAARPE